ncbi:uncharacterized protein LOC124926805 [Impatiens glandulifera]|uniref:uncharacterized protein LOC124926805 n=1 Tax=Impatiens glandulifera TaxID=253017 RepID=UPI001FB0A2FE|nr:uncharacterized protein LOC124926805 [Impatiens glandulifera]
MRKKKSNKAKEVKELVMEDLKEIVEEDNQEKQDKNEGKSNVVENSIMGQIYKTKLNPNGIVGKYKEILVAKGYNQRDGIDFHDNFSPVARAVTQFDVNNAFLHDDLMKMYTCIFQKG